MPSIGECSICHRIGVIKRGWCPMHYARWKKWGDPFYENTRRVWKSRVAFSTELWNRWLEEFNAPRGRQYALRR